MESSGVKKMERQIERAKKKEEDPSFILDDITREIVKRLPLRSVLRLCTVSSSWLAMISQFNYAQSHNPANFLFTSMRTLESSELYRWFHWSSQGEVLMDNGGAPRYSQLVSRSSCYSCQPVGGLILCYTETYLLVCNPSLGKFLNLPRIPISGVCYFGFDPIGARFKVLAVSESSGDEHVDAHVLTLVEGEESSWRPIQSNHPHSPVVNWLSPAITGIFFDGKIHYLATLKSNKKVVLMTFDMHSEKYSITPFPKEARPPLSTHELIKFNGKLALAPYPVLHGNFDVFVLDDFNKHTWSKQSFDIPGWGNLVHWRLDKVDMDEHYHCKGTVPTGELIFAPDRLIRGAVDLLSFDMEDEVLSIVKIEGVASEDDDYLVETFLNFIEEPLLLPGGTKDFYRKKGNMSSPRE